MKRLGAIGITVLLTVCCGRVDSQENPAPYSFLPAEPNRFPTINQYNFIWEGLAGRRELHFTRADETLEPIGYFQDLAGWGFYNQEPDTFYLAYEINVHIGDSLVHDTVRAIGSVVVFTNPFPDVFESESFIQDPAILVFLETNGDDWHGPGFRLYTRSFHTNDLTASDCVLQDTNGTLYRQFYPNGQLRAKGYYRDGKPSGTWIFCHADGSLLQKHTFE